MDGLLSIAQLAFVLIGIFGIVASSATTLWGLYVSAIVYCLSAYISYSEDSWVPLIVGGVVLYGMRAMGLEPSDDKVEKNVMAAYGVNKSSINVATPSEKNIIFALMLLNSFSYAETQVPEQFHIDEKKFMSRFIYLCKRLDISPSGSGRWSMMSILTDLVIMFGLAPESGPVFRIIQKYKRSVSDVDIGGVRSAGHDLVNYLVDHVFMLSVDAPIISSSKPDAEIINYLAHNHKNSGTCEPHSNITGEVLHATKRVVEPPPSKQGRDIKCAACGNVVAHPRKKVVRCNRCGNLINIDGSDTDVSLFLLKEQWDKQNLDAANASVSRQLSDLSQTNARQTPVSPSGKSHPSESFSSSSSASTEGGGAYNKQSTAYEVAPAVFSERATTKPWILNKKTGELRNNEKNISLEKSQYRWDGHNGIWGVVVIRHPTICWINDWDIERI